MEYFSNPPGPCPSERLPKPKEIQQTDPKKRKLADDKGLLTFDNDQYLAQLFFSATTAKKERP